MLLQTLSIGRISFTRESRREKGFSLSPGHYFWRLDQLVHPKHMISPLLLVDAFSSCQLLR